MSQADGDEELATRGQRAPPQTGGPREEGSREAPHGTPEEQQLSSPRQVSSDEQMNSRQQPQEVKPSTSSSRQPAEGGPLGDEERRLRQAQQVAASLRSAASEGKVELVRLLLRCGADVDGQDEEVSGPSNGHLLRPPGL